MTIKEAYSNTLRILKKHKAPALYVDDFIFWFYTAQINKFSILYGLYERNQQLSDDLQPLLRHVIVDLTDTSPYPINLLNTDGTPFISFDSYDAYGNPQGAIPTNYGPFTVFHSELNGTQQFQEYRREYYLHWGSTIELLDNVNFNINAIIHEQNSFDTMHVSDVKEGTFLKLSSNSSAIIPSVRDYRYGGNTNILEYGFDLGFNVAGNSMTITYDKPLYFRWDKDRMIWNIMREDSFTVIADNKIMVSAPPDYWHVLDITDHISYRNNTLCEKYFEKSYSLKRLNNDVYNGRKNNVYLEAYYNEPYFKEEFDAIVQYPKFEIEYCNISEKDLVILNKVEFLYLIEPQKYYFTEDDLEGTDNTEVLPFPEYICKELVDSAVKLILESDIDERLRTQPAINDTVIGRYDGVVKK